MWLISTKNKKDGPKLEWATEWAQLVGQAHASPFLIFSFAAWAKPLFFYFLLGLGTSQPNLLLNSNWAWNKPSPKPNNSKPSQARFLLPCLLFIIFFLASPEPWPTTKEETAIIMAQTKPKKNLVPAKTQPRKHNKLIRHKQCPISKRAN